MSPRAYAIMHRMHHDYTDTEKDPHSPSFSSNIFSMMWKTKDIYASIVNGKFPVEKRFTKNLPEWNKFDKWCNSPASKILWGAAYITFFILFASSLWLFLLLPVVLVMGAFHGAVINWFAHKVGANRMDLLDSVIYKYKERDVNWITMHLAHTKHYAK